MKILVVDDDRALREALRRALTLSGYDVQLADGGAQALEMLAQAPPDAVVLDVSMPDVDGLEVCRRLRRIGHRVPVLILTARDAVADRIDGLDVGADDYMVKPFDVGELRARLRALLRRTAPNEEASEEPAFAELRLDSARHGVVVDKAAAGATAAGGAAEGGAAEGGAAAGGAAEGGAAAAGHADPARAEERFVELTRTEYQLLELLLRNPRRVLTHSVIYERVWGYDFGPSSNALRVYVGYLRRKLAQAGARPLIHNVRGIGYVLRES
jgi:two-component system, OmpR family, response regulator MprA